MRFCAYVDPPTGNARLRDVRVLEFRRRLTRSTCRPPAPRNTPLVEHALTDHFGDVMPEGVAQYPALVVGRLPEHVIGGRPLGYRSAVTLPPDGTTAPRESGLFFHNSFIPMDVDYDSKIEGVVVDG